MSTQFELADVWRNPQDTRWEKAHRCISQVFFRALSKHPINKEAPTKEERESWLGMFWVHLTQSPNTLAAHLTHNEGALYTESLRFLDKRHSAEGSNIRQKLIRHLRSKKVLPVLQEEEAFQNIYANFWELLEKTTISGLGAIPAILKPQREGQIPPLVQKEILPPFLKEIVATLNRPTTDWEITKEVWGRLEPNPDGVLFMGAEPEKEEQEDSSFVGVSSGGNEFKSHHEPDNMFEMDLPFYLNEILDTLDQKDQHVVALLMEQYTQQDVATELGISRRGVQDAYVRFRQVLQTIVEQEKLEEDEVRIIMQHLVQTWQVENFSYEKGEKS